MINENGSGHATAPTSFWRKPRTRTALLAAGFLVIGFGLGSVATSAVIHRTFGHGMRDPRRLASRAVSRMRGDLDLTDEQAAAIQPILEKHFAGVRDAIRGRHDAIRAEVEPLLTPGQRAAYDRIFEARRARFLGEESDSGAPPAPGRETTSP